MKKLNLSCFLLLISTFVFPYSSNIPKKSVRDRDGRANDFVVIPNNGCSIAISDLSNIKSLIGNVSQPASADTVLGVLGDADSILGKSISQAINDISGSGDVLAKLGDVNQPASDDTVLGVLGDADVALTGSSISEALRVVQLTLEGQGTAAILNVLGDVSQAASDDTVLGVLGDADSILGKSISQAIGDIAGSGDVLAVLGSVTQSASDDTVLGVLGDADVALTGSSISQALRVVQLTLEGQGTAAILNVLGDVSQAASDDTVLGVLGDADVALTGSSISTALAALKTTLTDGDQEIKDILGTVAQTASDDTVLGVLGDADVALTGSSISQALRVVQLTLEGQGTAAILSVLGDVSQAASDDTVLGVLGDADVALTGSSISTALAALKTTLTDGDQDIKNILGTVAQTASDDTILGVLGDADAVLGSSISTALNTVKTDVNKIGAVTDAPSDDTILGILGDADVALTGSSISEALRVVQLTVEQQGTAAILSVLGDVSQAASDDTVLGVLGDADVALTGSSISEALRVVQLTLEGQGTAAILNVLGNVSQAASDDTVLGVLGNADDVLGTSIAQGIEDLQITSTQADGLPITAAITISSPGLYFVANDFTGDITINSDDVTIEGKGRTVTGTITASSHIQICIHNLRVNGNSADTINFESCSNICLKHVFVHDGTRGFDFTSCTSIKMEDCWAESSNEYGCRIYDTDNVVVDQSRFETTAGSSEDGMYVGYSSNLIIIDSDFNNNNAMGLNLVNTGTCVISGCNFVGNVDGIRLTAATNITIENSSCVRNSSDGIELQAGVTNVLVENCKFMQNGGYGINNATAANNLFLNNFSTSNVTADYKGVTYADTIKYNDLGAAGTYDNIYVGTVA